MLVTIKLLNKYGRQISSVHECITFLICDYVAMFYYTYVFRTHSWSLFCLMDLLLPCCLFRNLNSINLRYTITRIIPKPLCSLLCSFIATFHRISKLTALRSAEWQIRTQYAIAYSIMPNLRMRSLFNIEILFPFPSSS